MSAAQASKTNGRSRGPRVPLVNPVPTPPAVGMPAPQPTPSLDAAVLRVQAKAARLVRNAQGQIQSRFYTYVTLTAVTDEVLPLLVEEQLLWKVFPTTLEEGKPGLRYKMTHVPTGEFDEDVMPLLCDPTMQALGSAITYGRRYALVPYLQLTVEEDDDGASANMPATYTEHAGGIPPVDRYAEAAAAHAELENGSTGGKASQPTARAPQEDPQKASPSQVKMLYAKASAAKLSKVVFANEVKQALGEAPSTSKDQRAAKRWLDRNLPRVPRALVDDVVARIAHAAAEGSQA